MRAAGDEAGDVRDVGDEDRADLVGDLGERREVDGARDRGAAAEDELRPLGLGELADLVDVDAAVSLRTPYCTARKYLPVRETFQPCVRWPPAGSAMPMTVSPGSQEREVDREVRRRAGVRLHVGVLGAEQRLGALDRERLDLVDDLLALVVALARVALGVLVREHRAGRLEHRARDVVLRRDQPDRVALAAVLGGDQVGDLGVGGAQVRVGGAGTCSLQVVRRRR